jgi:lipoprotein-releasing system permease protein
MQTNAQLLAALRNQTITTIIIRIFVTAIVALGIASVLVVSVVQKSREIGILRAMGTSSRAVMRVFLYQGAIVGFLGSLLGSIFAGALLLSFPLIFRDTGGAAFFEPDAAPELFISAILVAVLTGIIAAAMPARRAAKLDPVTAIRYG